MRAARPGGRRCQSLSEARLGGGTNDAGQGTPEKQASRSGRFSDAAQGSVDDAWVDCRPALSLGPAERFAKRGGWFGQVAIRLGNGPGSHGATASGLARAHASVLCHGPGRQAGRQNSAAPLKGTPHGRTKRDPLAGGVRGRHLAGDHGHPAIARPLRQPLEHGDGPGPGLDQPRVGRGAVHLGRGPAFGRRGGRAMGRDTGAAGGPAALGAGLPADPLDGGGLGPGA